MKPDPILPVIYADIALKEIDEIADWNEKTYGRDHARRYCTFLEGRIDDLGSSYAKGRIVGVRPDLRYIIIRRRNHGHGHVAVYSFDHKSVNVLHVFHTAQNWEPRVSRE